MKGLLKRLLPDVHQYDDRLHLQKLLGICCREKKLTNYGWFCERENVRKLNDKQVSEKIDYYTTLLNAE